MGLSCDPPLGLLCIPILLVALPFARAGEEVCCSGAYSMAPPLGDLEQLDGARLSFCCVACNLSYCCSSAEARLNQQLCSALQADPADDRGKGFIQPRTIQPGRRLPLLPLQRGRVSWLAGLLMLGKQHLEKQASRRIREPSPNSCPMS